MTAYQTAPKAVYSSPTSLTGGTRRIIRAWPRPANTFAHICIWWLVLPITLLLVWCVLIMWNVLAFTVFGLFVIPFRLHRRAGRREMETQRLQLEALQQLAQNSK